MYFWKRFIAGAIVSALLFVQMPAMAVADELSEEKGVEFFELEAEKPVGGG